jgi:hypothetical protein
MFYPNGGGSSGPISLAQFLQMFKLSWNESRVFRSPSLLSQNRFYEHDLPRRIGLFFFFLFLYAFWDMTIDTNLPVTIISRCYSLFVHSTDTQAMSRNCR